MDRLSKDTGGREAAAPHPPVRLPGVRWYVGLFVVACVQYAAAYGISLFENRPKESIVAAIGLTLALTGTATFMLLCADFTAGALATAGNRWALTYFRSRSYRWGARVGGGLAAVALALFLGIVALILVSVLVGLVAYLAAIVGFFVLVVGPLVLFFFLCFGGGWRYR